MVIIPPVGLIAPHMRDGVTTGLYHAGGFFIEEAKT
jgi:hypothetical protein